MVAGSIVIRDFQAAGVGGLDWAPGTRWRGGLTDDQIDEAQRRYGLVFPPDYRRFLATLHTTDPEMIGASYRGSKLVPKTGPGPYDWLGDHEPILTALAAPVEGLLWSIEANIGWHPNWGPRPETESGRAAVVRELAASGPPLVPVFAHHYLVASPLADGNPVLSMNGSDVIILADDLETYFAYVLNGQRIPDGNLGVAGISATPIGFWQDVIDDGLPT